MTESANKCKNLTIYSTTSGNFYSSKLFSIFVHQRTYKPKRITWAGNCSIICKAFSSYPVGTLLISNNDYSNKEAKEVVIALSTFDSQILILASSVMLTGILKDTFSPSLLLIPKIMSLSPYFSADKL